MVAKLEAIEIALMISNPRMLRPMVFPDVAMEILLPVKEVLASRWLNNKGIIKFYGVNRYFLVA